MLINLKIKQIKSSIAFCKEIVDDRKHIMIYTPWNTVQGGRGLIPEMIQVCDYDILIVLVELNTLI